MISIFSFAFCDSTFLTFFKSLFMYSFIPNYDTVAYKMLPNAMVHQWTLQALRKGEQVPSMLAQTVAMNAACTIGWSCTDEAPWL